MSAGAGQPPPGPSQPCWRRNPTLARAAVSAGFPGAGVENTGAGPSPLRSARQAAAPNRMRVRVVIGLRRARRYPARCRVRPDCTITASSRKAPLARPW